MTRSGSTPHCKSWNLLSKKEDWGYLGTSCIWMTQAAEAGSRLGSGYHKAKARKTMKNWIDAICQDLKGMELTWEEEQQLSVNKEWRQSVFPMCHRHVMNWGLSKTIYSFTFIFFSFTLYTRYDIKHYHKKTQYLEADTNCCEFQLIASDDLMKGNQWMNVVAE